MDIQQTEAFAKEWIQAWRKQRSEEHTSELQSQSNLVCRLLLEKKTQNRTQTLSMQGLARNAPALRTKPSTRQLLYRTAAVALICLKNASPLFYFHSRILLRSTD